VRNFDWLPFTPLWSLSSVLQRSSMSTSSIILAPSSRQIYIVNYGFFRLWSEASGLPM
jgi:hypothetical protein